jgi:hypothetical protein
MIARSDTISKTKIEPQCASMTAECTKKFDVVVRSLQLCHRKMAGVFHGYGILPEIENPFWDIFGIFPLRGYLIPF